MRWITRWLAGLGKLGLIALVFASLLEGMLRLFPAAIPLQILKGFEPGLRGAIAKRLALPTISDQVAVRRDDDGPPLTIYAPNQLIRTRFRDSGIVNEVRMDTQGFCNPPSVDPARERFDIIALGDSFTWCTNVHPEAAWAHQLGGMLDRSVYNLSRGAIGLYEYIQLFKAFGLVKKPKLVVLNVYEGNDLRDAIRYHDHVNKIAHGTARELSLNAHSTVEHIFEWGRSGWLHHNSYAFNLGLVVAQWAYQSLPRSGIQLTGEPDFRYTLRFPEAAIAFNPENVDGDELVHARALADGRISPTVLDAALDAIAALSDEHKFELLVIYSPSAHTAYAEFVTFAEAAAAPLMKQYSDTLRRYLGAATAARKIPFLDLTPALQQAARKLGGREFLYYRTTVHFTAQGHNVVAEAIQRHLEEHER